MGGIILINLILSGDNAFVLGAAASKLPRKQRWVALLFGGGAAIILRILFTVIATLLLQLPLLQVMGAGIIFYIAIRLLVDRDKELAEAARETKAEPGNTSAVGSPKIGHFLQVMSTILIADVTMSLDNVLAIGALAQGNFLAIFLGLLISIIILLFASAIVAELIVRLPWLLDIAALILAWTAATMVLHDVFLGSVLNRLAPTTIALPIGNVSWIGITIALVLLGGILAVDIFLRLRHNRRINEIA